MSVSTRLLAILVWFCKVEWVDCCEDPSHDSYCVTGVDIGENAFSICSDYVYAGYHNGCKYFVNVEYSHSTSGENIYIYWNDYNDYWNIGPDIDDTLFYAYCDETSLDNCDKGEWRYYNGEDTIYRYALTIYQCSYNNTQCEQDISDYYSSSSSSTSISSDKIMEFCMRKTNQRSVNDIGGKFSTNGSCIEEEPVYIHESSKIWDREFRDLYGYNASTALARDEELNSWVIVKHHNGALSGAKLGVVGWCEEDDLKDCNHRWNIYDGNETGDWDTLLDSSVISGDCRECIESDFIDFNEYCIIATDLNLNENDDIIGRYYFNDTRNGDYSCYETLPYFVKRQTETMFGDIINNTDIRNDVILHFEAEYEIYSIDIDFSLYLSDNKSLVWCYINESSGNPDLRYCTNDEWYFCQVGESLWSDDTYCQRPTLLETGVCSETVDLQCSDPATCFEITSSEDDDETGYDWLGNYDYYGCDSNGYVMYVKNDTESSTQTDTATDTEQKLNVFLIFFSTSDNYFYISDFYNTTKKYAACNSLMLDYCTNIWYSFSTFSDGVVFTSELNEKSCKNNSNNSSFDTEIFVTIGIVVGVILGSICLCIGIRKCARSIFAGSASKREEKWRHEMGISNSYETNGQGPAQGQSRSSVTDAPVTSIAPATNISLAATAVATYNTNMAAKTKAKAKTRRTTPGQDNNFGSTPYGYKNTNDIKNGDNYNTIYNHNNNNNAYQTSSWNNYNNNNNNNYENNKESISLAEDKPSNTGGGSPVDIDPNWWQNLESIYLSTDSAGPVMDGENGSVYSGGGYTDPGHSDYNIAAPAAPSAPYNYNNYPSLRSIYAPSEGPGHQHTTSGLTIPEPSKELIKHARQASVQSINSSKNIRSNINAVQQPPPPYQPGQNDNEHKEGGGSLYTTHKDNIRFLDLDDWELLATWTKDGKIKGIPMLYNRVEKKHYFPHKDERTREVARRFGVPLPPQRKRV